MKRVVLFSAVILSLIFISSQAVAADRPQQKPIIQVHKAAKAVTIDGNLNEYPKFAVRMDDKSFEKLQYFEYGGKDDISADIYLLWDDENLYVAAKITDDVPFTNKLDGPDIWNGDSIEVLLGMDDKADPQRIYFGKGDYQIGLSAGNNKDIKPNEWIWRRDDYQSGIELTAKPADKGYTIEAKIPFKVLGGFKPEIGKRFDFNIAVDDADKDKRDMQLVWTGTKNFYSDPSEWGSAVLSAPQAAFAISYVSYIVLMIVLLIAVVFMIYIARRPT